MNGVWCAAGSAFGCHHCSAACVTCDGAFEVKFCVGVGFGLISSCPGEGGGESVAADGVPVLSRWLRSAQDSSVLLLDRHLCSGSAVEVA